MEKNEKSKRQFILIAVARVFLYFAFLQQSVQYLVWERVYMQEEKITQGYLIAPDD